MKKQADTPELDGDKVIVLQVDPAAICGESKAMEAARQSLRRGHCVLLKPEQQDVYAGGSGGRQPRVLLSFLAIGWGLIAATVAVALYPDLPVPALIAFATGTIIGAIVTKRDAERHPECYPI